jgi:hypothetical protein
LPAETSAQLLLGWTLEVGSDGNEPARRAARLLEGLGAEIATGDAPGDQLRVIAPGGATGTVSLEGWEGDGFLAESLLALVPDSPTTPTGDVLGAYCALRIASEAPLAPSSGDITLRARDCLDELFAAFMVNPQTPRPELVRCRDGWIVVRLRDEDERMLFGALTGPGEPASVRQAVDECRIARLLVGPVRPPRGDLPFVLPDVSLDGVGRPVPSLRVVDWTVLWAGPWMTQQLCETGARVHRIEHPRRRDGLLGWPEGRAWWEEMNGAKELALLDMSSSEDRDRFSVLVQSADILVTSMTARSIRSLGFDDDWRRSTAPACLHVELVAYEEPWADAPGLGEHAAAQAGLSWRGEARPAGPYPWADPMLGAAGLALSRAWLACPERRGGRVRLSLEGAASLAFASA